MQNLTNLVKNLLVLFILTAGNSAQSQNQNQSFFFTYTNDTHFQVNKTRQTSAVKGLLEIGLTYQLTSEISFNTNGFFLHGQSISKSFGDVFFISSIDGRNTARLQNFWLEYAPQNSNWILRLGKQAFDDEFLVTKKSDLFIHGAGAFVFTLPNSSPQWPIATPAALLKFSLGSSQIKTAVYLADTNLTNEAVNLNGLNFSLAASGLMSIVEYSNTLPKIDFRVGLFNDSNKSNFSSIYAQRSTTAFYAIAEPLIYNNLKRDFILSAHVAYSRVFERSTAVIDYDARLALFIDSKLNHKQVRFGIGFFYPHVGQAISSQNSSFQGSEHFTEATFELQLSKQLQWRAAFQRVMNPGAPIGLNQPNGTFLVSRLSFEW